MPTSLTVREAAARVGRTEETVRRWIWSGRLAATKRGNTLFIDEDDLPAAGDIGRPSYPPHRPEALTLAAWAQRVKAWRQTTPRGTGSAADLVIEDRTSHDRS